MCPAMAAIDPAAAALIGAGSASVITLLSQFLAHGLGIRRDRRNARRERFREPVMAAAYALARIDEPTSDSEGDREPPDLDSPEALRPWSDAMHERLGTWSRNTIRAWMVLGITFGHDHRVVQEYSDVRIQQLNSHRADYQNSLKIRQSQDFHEVRRLEDNYKELARGMVEATQACEAWTRRALAVVDKA
jgi:hypothetical protein